MKFKTRRQARYSHLRLHGILPFEARPWSKVNWKVCPYLVELFEERKSKAKKAEAQGVTPRQWEEYIRGLYRKNGWLKRDRLGRIIADPWKMFRDYEDRYKQKYPQYESPWQPRGRQWKDFLRKIERTRAMQRGLV